MTTKHNQQEREKYAKAAEEAGKKIEETADEFIDDSVSLMQKLKEKKWSAAAIVSAGIGIAFLLIR